MIWRLSLGYSDSNTRGPTAVLIPNLRITYNIKLSSTYYTTPRTYDQNIIIDEFLIGESTEIDFTKYLRAKAVTVHDNIGRLTIQKIEHHIGGIFPASGPSR